MAANTTTYQDIPQSVQSGDPVPYDSPPEGEMPPIEIPPEYLAAWEASLKEIGAPPSERQFAKRLRELTGGIGGTTHRRQIHRQLLKMHVSPKPEADTLQEPELALAAAERDLERARASMQEAQTQLEQLDTALAELRLNASRGDAESAAAIGELESQQWKLHRAIERQFPGAIAQCEAAVQQANTALAEATRKSHLAGCVSLAAQRRSIVEEGGTLDQALQVLEGVLETYQALTSSHRNEASLAGIPFVGAETQTSIFVYQRLMHVLPQPFGRSVDQAVRLTRPIEDLVQADSTLQETTPQRLEATAHTGTLFITWQGAEFPSLASCGISRPLAVQSSFLRREAIEVSMQELSQLRGRYGNEAVEVVSPPVAGR